MVVLLVLIISLLMILIFFWVYNLKEVDVELLLL